MAVSRDSKFLINLGGDDGHVKKISIPSQKVVKDFGRISDGFIATIQLASGDKNLFVYDGNSNLKLIDLTDATTVHYLERVQKSRNYGHQSMLVTRDGEHMFTSSSNSELKQWSVRGRAIVRELGNITRGTKSICD